MKIYFYLSLIPESLIASMLPPEEFGNYYAVGNKKRSRGQALFFEITPFESDLFPFQDVDKLCIPHTDGQPKRSVYLGIYRVLEHVPLSSLQKLYLVTDDGRVLGLDQASYETESGPLHYLYQEFCPVNSRVVSQLNPEVFCQSITNRSLTVSVSKIVFCELILKKLSRDPDSPEINDLPYTNIGHLRDCLRELEEDPTHKHSKVVHRGMPPDMLFRTIKNGFFVGDHLSMLYYPLPSAHQLEREYYEWWRSALSTFS